MCSALITARRRPSLLTRRSALRSQVIDEQVERGHDLCGAEDEGVPDTHAEVGAVGASLGGFRWGLSLTPRRPPRRCARPHSSGSSRRSFTR